MDVFRIFLSIYLVIGFVYALYIWLFAGDSWYEIPVNIIGGPISIVVETIKAFRHRSYEIKDTFKGKKAVIFDLDGTLVDSQPYWIQAMENVLGSIGADWVDQDYAFGAGLEEKWESILRAEKGIETKLSPKELAEKTRQEFLKVYTDVVAKDGFWELAQFLKEKKSFKLGLVTNSSRAIITAVLERLEAESVFDFTMAGDEVKKRKPHPEIYRVAAKNLKIKPKDVVVFEDTIVGATAARKAGMEVLVIWDGVDEDPQEFPKGIHFFLSNFDDLPQAIEKTTREQLEEVAAELEKEGISQEDLQNS